jgi:hypothetical protein
MRLIVYFYRPIYLYAGINSLTGKVMRNTNIGISGFAILMAILVFCQGTHRSGREAELKAMKEVLRAEKQAHLDHDVEQILALCGNVVIYIDRAEIEIRPAEQIRERFERYFSSTEILEWSDIEDPIIKVSDDGTLAVAIVKKSLF